MAQGAPPNQLYHEVKVRFNQETSLNYLVSALDKFRENPESAKELSKEKKIELKETLREKIKPEQTKSNVLVSLKDAEIKAFIKKRASMRLS